MRVIQMLQGDGGNGGSDDFDDEQKLVDPQMEDELVSCLQKILKSAATSIGSDHIYIPGYNEKDIQCSHQYLHQ